MRKRNHPPHQAILTERSPLPWGYFLLTVICASILAAGFFFAARQHFTAMDFGLKNSKLRKQVEELEGEKRRLLLAREVVRSPGEIMRVARSRGLRDVGTDVAVLAVSKKPGDVTSPIVRSNMASLSDATLDDRKPIKAFFPVAAVKPIVSAKPTKSLDEGKEGKPVSESGFVAKLR